MGSNLFDLIDSYTAEPVPVQIEFLIRDLGIKLNKKADLPQEIAGEIASLGEGQYEIRINKNDHYFRQRFTMAHELGHFIFHKHLLGDGVITDTRLYRSTNPEVVTPYHEIQANKFAAELLMPLKHVQNDFAEMQDVQKVAAKWQVSPQAMKIRLEEK